ncbi:Outer membrane lipoprotein-sorting protein [Halorientalis persicus]|uniref:Outer membrane lipoprotein-sorting protein n=1 Tax=Halorientalis persicus TaxID=1367881 RepID=A0A1H8IDD0_9EURY|nr:outer membrane lipoprotein carrier protein LolA [Halorientalis persicus]SEN66793.1 Outer membrane lipoprotein-sorting protein [Halorientalis persicus]
MTPPLRSRHRRALLGVVGLVFVTAGCLGAPGTEVDDPSVVAEQVESRYERLDGFQATMIQRVTVGSETETTRATVTFDKGDSLRIAYETGPKAGDVAVIENPSAKLFAGEARTDAEASARLGTVAADLVRENEVVFEGTERLDGRSTAVFSITPPDDGAATQPERRVWVDAKQVVPRRIESTWTEDGQRVNETIRFENVSLGVPATDADATPGGATA